MNKESINKKDEEVQTVRKEDRIELAFPKYEEHSGGLIAKGRPGEGFVERLSTSMDAISIWFRQYQVESIELWISGLIETGGVTKLVVSAKGEGGMRVILKPQTLTTERI